jgi:hypothetical protein
MGGEMRKVRLVLVSPLGFLMLHGFDVTCRLRRVRGGERFGWVAKRAGCVEGWAMFVQKRWAIFVEIL